MEAKAGNYADKKCQANSDQYSVLVEPRQGQRSGFTTRIFRQLGVCRIPGLNNDRHEVNRAGNSDGDLVHGVRNHDCTESPCILSGHALVDEFAMVVEPHDAPTAFAAMLVEIEVVPEPVTSPDRVIVWLPVKNAEA